MSLCRLVLRFLRLLCDHPLHSAHLQTREILWLRAVAPLRAQSLCSLLLPKPSSCLIHRVRPHSRCAKNPSATAADSRVIPPLFGVFFYFCASEHLHHPFSALPDRVCPVPPITPRRIFQIQSSLRPVISILGSIAFEWP